MPTRARKANIKQTDLGEIQKVAAQTRETDFWLFVQFADVLIRYIEITMKEDSITSRLQGAALYFLLLKEGKSTPTQLARMMLRSRHSITKIIDSLEKEGLVVRDFTNKDRRVTHIKITSAGLENVQNRFNKGNERAKKVMECLDATEHKLLVNLIEKMRKKMISIINIL